MTELEPFFHAAEQPNIEPFEPEVKQWFENLVKLDESDCRKASIWFSRYCFNPEKTMSEVQSVLDLETAKEAAERGEPQQSSEPEPVVIPTSYRKTPTARSPQTQADSPRPKKAKKTQHWSSLIFPIGWAIATIMIITIGITSANPAKSAATICANAPGSKSYCQLAVQIVGSVTFQQAKSQKMVPMTDETKEQGVGECLLVAYYGSKESEDLSDPDAPNPMRSQSSYRSQNFFNNPNISSSSEEIFPGIFVADVKTPSAEEGSSSTRTACVFANTEEELVHLYADTIPVNWPAEPYVNKEKPVHESMAHTLGIYSNLINFGAGTFFTAIGLFIAATFGLGIRIESIEALYKAAFFLGLVEGLMSFIPGLGWMSIAVETIALGIVSAFIKGFDVLWSDGYRIVAFGALIIIGTRFICGIALLSLISWMVF